jgi:hypothetical protein
MSVLSEYIVIVAGVVLAGGYFFRDSLFKRESKSTNNEPLVNTGGGDARDFVSKMKATVRTTLSLFLPYYQRMPHDLVAPRPLNWLPGTVFQNGPTVSPVTPGSSDACPMQNRDFCDMWHELAAAATAFDRACLRTLIPPNSREASRLNTSPTLSSYVHGQLRPETFSGG